MIPTRFTISNLLLVLIYYIFRNFDQFWHPRVHCILNEKAKTLGQHFYHKIIMITTNDWFDTIHLFRYRSSILWYHHITLSYVMIPEDATLVGKYMYLIKSIVGGYHHRIFVLFFAKKIIGRLQNCCDEFNYPGSIVYLYCLILGYLRINMFCKCWWGWLQGTLLDPV